MVKRFPLRRLTFLALLACCHAATWAGVVRGHITDKATGEPLAGATITVRDTRGQTVATAAADADGAYRLALADATCTVAVRYIGYAALTATLDARADDQVRDFRLAADAGELAGIAVVAEARKDNEAAETRRQQESLVVQSGVSAQQITRSGDKDASEAIRRVPGVSVIDGRHVMVRGLSQRYNNVWLNGGAVPSAEADSRAFSFDLLPAQQIAAMTVVKSPTPEYPADFTGGFVLIDTKQPPAGGGVNVSLGYGVNDRTHFRSFLHAAGAGADWLGFGAGSRALAAGMRGTLPEYAGFPGRIDARQAGLLGRWTTQNSTPWGDIKLAADGSHVWHTGQGGSLGLLAALNYAHETRTLTHMENSLYGPYDLQNDQKVYLRKATDDQYATEARLGLLLNLWWQPRDTRHRVEWKNVFNQTGRDRYTERTGFNAQPDNIQQTEYQYQGRTVFNTQFTGRHDLALGHIDWSAAYAYSSRLLPDRRMIDRTDRTDQRMGIYRISREWTALAEHTASLAANWRRELRVAGLAPTLRAGLYGEYRTRDYRTRQLQYAWQPDNTLPHDFQFDDDVPHHVLTDDNMAPDKLYIYEEVNHLNDYAAASAAASAYTAVLVPWRQWSLYVGVRYEYCRQTLDLNTRQYEESRQRTHYDHHDLFPSANLVWRMADGHQLRAAYGRSVNRPEFRELAPSVFYDFELGSDVMGNYDLRPAYIDNLDLRWEWYPSAGEQVSVALFYKHFRDPIEWTYTVAGGTDLIYSFINARGANNYGVEVDVRKRLDFLGLPSFSLAANAAWIKSRVSFQPGTNNIDRPMQGQSPYLINLGLFYQHPRNGWTAAALYNRIGRRIVGVGNRYGTAAGGEARNIPNSYEMPRDQLDLSVGKQLGRWQLKLAVRDVLAQRCLFKQMETVQGRHIEETTKSYRPGRNISLTVGCKL